MVHCDETSWSINSVWAFLNDTLTVVFYGVHKDAATLEQILDKRQFAGTLVSDNAAIYQGFTKSQKCWAHLIRKAIKLTLQDPENEHYRKLADNLLLIYRDAKKAAVDGRLGDDGRERRVTELYDRVVDACGLGWTNETVGGESVRDDYHRLCNEIMKLMIDRELFVFVELPGVVGTNNSSERQLRGDALARKTGRTSKTPRGAQRQSDLAPESWSMRSVKKFVNFHNPGGSNYEAKKVYRRANCICTSSGRIRNAHCGHRPQDGHYRANVLPVEKEICRDGRCGSSAFKAA